MLCQKLKTYMETGRVIFVPAKNIRPNPAQPRKIFKPEELEELAESIRRHGILQPLSVRRVGNTYELIAGERRLRAGILAGLTEVPCIVMTMDDKESGMTALVENLQRQDLDYIEEAQGISYIMDRWTMSQEQAARLLGKSQSAVANKLRLLRHSNPVLRLLRQRGLTERHARALLRLSDPQLQLELAQRIGAQSLTVAQTEALVEQLLADPPPKDRKRPVFLLKDVRLFLNTLTRSLDLMRSAGVDAQFQRSDTEDAILLTIQIPRGSTP